MGTQVIGRITDTLAIEAWGREDGKWEVVICTVDADGEFTGDWSVLRVFDAEEDACSWATSRRESLLT